MIKNRFGGPIRYFFFALIVNKTPSFLITRKKKQEFPSKCHNFHFHLTFNNKNNHETMSRLTFIEVDMSNILFKINEPLSISTLYIYCM